MVKWASRGRKTFALPQCTTAEHYVCNILTLRTHPSLRFPICVSQGWPRPSQETLFWVYHSWYSGPASVGCSFSSSRILPNTFFTADGRSNAEGCAPLPESRPACLELGARSPRPRIPIWVLPSEGSSFPGTMGGLPSHEGHCGERSTVLDPAAGVTTGEG